MSLNNLSSKLLTVIVGLTISAVLILAIPFISGSMQEDEVIPMLVINSINFHKKIIIEKKKVPKPKQKVIDKLKKTVKKRSKKVKKIIKKLAKQKKVVKPIEKNFSTRHKKPEKVVKTQEDEIPIPEPIYRVTEKPRFLRAIIPTFPYDMQRLGKAAVVTVDALIDRKGKVRKTTIYKSAGKSFDDAAITAIKKSVFIPGKIDGKPVAVLYRMKIKFNLI